LNGFFCVVNSFRGLVQHGWRITFGDHSGLPRLSTTNPVRDRLFLWLPHQPRREVQAEVERRIAAGEIDSVGTAGSVVGL
jgi:hypothetical protein